MHCLADHPGQVRVEAELNQWLSTAELQQLQLDRVNALLAHAVAHVPFHRRRLATHTGRAPQLGSLAELATLPILTKAEIQANLEAMLATGAARHDWIKNATGGSTGEPLVFYRDPRAQLWVEAAKERFRRWLGAVNEDKLALIWGADRDFPPTIPANEKWLNVFNCREEQIERFIKELIVWQPRTIRGYAGSLHLVAQFIKSRGLPPVRPHAVESAAETLTPEMRRDIEAAFGAPVFNFYGAREISCIACEDREHRVLRVADDVRLVEILRDGTPAAPGEEGKLIITDLVNYAMPLLRYEIGDVGTAPAAAGGDTDCNFTRIAHIQGRTANTITAPDGRLIHGEFFTHLFYQKPGIRMFQVRQARTGDLEINVVPDGKFNADTLEKIAAIIREHVGPPAKVTWRTVTDIPATPTGKRLFTLSEIPVRFSSRTDSAPLAAGARAARPPVPPSTTARPPHPEPCAAPAASPARTRKPRILFLADRPGWAFDTNAHGVAEALRDDFEFRIEYVVQQPDLRAWEHDLLVVMFWGEDYHHRFGFDPRRVLKQVTSHRWALEEKFGQLTPEQTVARHLGDAATLIVPSLRLQKIFAPFRPTYLAPKGIVPAQYSDGPRPEGPLRVGWVGNREDPCKGLKEILLPATGSDFELRIAGGDVPPAQMAEFYRSIDVLCVASTGEGDPRPLIEGMASGCFPVAVDVGIVPELVEHRRSGLIVERKVEAFQAALQWCRCNTEFVRQTGHTIAPAVREARAWAKVAPLWRDAFHAALNAQAQPLPIAPPPVPAAQPIRPTVVPPTPRTPEAPARESAIASGTATARAFQSGYSLAEWEAAQPALETTFRAATGSPHAPAGYQDAVTYALAALRPQHQVILDVGAWVGNFALNAAVINPTATIFALEPEPANFVFLTRRAPVQVIPLRLAVARDCGQTEFHISNNSQGHTLYRELVNRTHSRKVTVRTIRFEQLVAMAGGSVDFMKINAEGAEFEILRSHAFRQVKEAVVKIHLEGTDGAKLLTEVTATHDVRILEDRSPRFLYVHLTRNSATCIPSRL